MGLSVGLSLLSTVGKGEFDDAVLGANEEGPLVTPGSIGEALGRDDGNESVVSSG